jgi:16S rRNA (guanine966-N2)-methyltransferase
MATRPTTDRTRESLFNILGNRLDFEGLRILDLYAGTGAIGCEALSRGAQYCLFVENAKPALKVIQANIKALGLTQECRVLHKDAAKLDRVGALPPFDLAFADPPYSKGLGEKSARSLRAGGWLSEGALFILEERKLDFPEELKGFDLEDRRDFGDTTIGIFQLIA